MPIGSQVKQRREHTVGPAEERPVHSRSMHATLLIDSVKQGESEEAVRRIKNRITAGSQARLKEPHECRSGSE